MTKNWRTLAIIITALAVPFGIALYQDSTRKASEEEILGALFENGWNDDGWSDDDWDDDDWDDDDDLKEALLLAEMQGYGDDEGDWEVTHAMDAAFFEKVFFAGGQADKPTLGGELAGAAFGKTHDQIASANPTLINWVDNDEHGEFGTASIDFTYEGEMTFEDRPDSSGADPNQVLGLRGMTFTFPDDGTARRMFTSRWGAPIVVSEEDTAGGFWFNPAESLRVHLSREDWMSTAGVAVDQYIPLNEFIAPEKRGRFGFERIQLLGASLEAVVREYGNAVAHADEYSVLLYLPPTDFTSGDSVVRLSLEDGRVTTIEVTIEDHRIDLLRQMLTDKLGTPRSDADGSTVFPGKPRVTLESEDLGADGAISYLVIRRN